MSATTVWITFRDSDWIVRRLPVNQCFQWINWSWCIRWVARVTIDLYRIERNWFETCSTRNTQKMNFSSLLAPVNMTSLNTCLHVDSHRYFLSHNITLCVLRHAFLFLHSLGHDILAWDGRSEILRQRCFLTNSSAHQPSTQRVASIVMQRLVWAALSSKYTEYTLYFPTKALSLPSRAIAPFSKGTTQWGETHERFFIRE